MFSIKSLLFFTTAATLLSSVAGQSWEVMVYEPSAGGSSSCTGGGTTISGSDTNCHTVGLGSNAASFNILSDNGTPGAEFVFNLFSDNNCQNDLGTQLGPGACFSGAVANTKHTLMPTLSEAFSEHADFGGYHYTWSPDVAGGEACR
ncbi:hypothetical protein DFH06DRAFT_1127611 [Mycena polygramma]|nr:hypothetical protein DFH06DRAFT_1127611 [Mycena polygramma]